eukprot:4849736-Amphidinium_carterae.1
MKTWAVCGDTACCKPQCSCHNLFVAFNFWYGRHVLTAWAYCAAKQLAGFASSLGGTGMAVPLLPVLPFLDCIACMHSVADARADAVAQGVINLQDQLSGTLPSSLVPVQAMLCSMQLVELSCHTQIADQRLQFL